MIAAPQNRVVVAVFAFALVVAWVLAVVALLSFPGCAWVRISTRDCVPKVTFDAGIVTVESCRDTLTPEPAATPTPLSSLIEAHRHVAGYY